MEVGPLPLTNTGGEYPPRSTLEDHGMRHLGLVCFKVMQVVGVVGDLVELSFAAILNTYKTNEGYRKTDAKMSGKEGIFILSTHSPAMYYMLNVHVTFHQTCSTSSMMDRRRGGH